MKFSKDFLVNELDLPYKVVEDKIIDSTRWPVIHKIVFKYDDKYYQTTYLLGATPMQYVAPWEYEDEVECTEVEQKEVLVTQWVPIE